MSRRAAEPIAIIGMAALYPGAGSLEELEQRLRTATPAPIDRGSARWPQAVRDALEPADRAQLAGRFVADPEIDLARFGIPPAQGVSISRAQLLFLDVVDRCLRDAGFPDRPLDRERVDVVCGCCF